MLMRTEVGSGGVAEAALSINLGQEANDVVERLDSHFRALIDLAITEGGSFYLTHHRWATGQQLRAAHPALPGVLRARARFDPGGVFDSSWARAIATSLAEAT